MSSEQGKRRESRRSGSMGSGLQLFEWVAETAESSGLLVLVIGGHAVNAYGYSRTTLDVDFMVCADDLPAWRTQFELAGYAWQGQTEAFAKFVPAGVDTPRFPLDLMLVNRDTWNKISADSVSKSFGSAELQVPKPLHMIALKLHALRNPARLKLGKDLADVMHLIRNCKIDPEGAEFREVLDRYASPETRDLIGIHLRQG